MSAFDTRLRHLETIWSHQAPSPSPIAAEYRRLSVAQRARARELAERIRRVGAEDLTPDEMLECAEFRRAIEVGTRA